MSTAGLPVTKPVSAWNKPLRADWKALFKTLADRAKHGVLGKWEELPGVGIELLSSIGLSASAGERAYLLIRRALTAAIHELVVESIPQFQIIQGAEKEMVERFDWSLEESDLRIDRSFFDRPDELAIVKNLQTPLWELLVAFSLDPARAKTVSSRLSTYFVFHLVREWREKQATYGPLQNNLEGPFAKAAEREQGWLFYNAWLQKQAYTPVFGESFSLRDVYIRLRGYWEQHDFEESGSPSPDDMDGRGIPEEHRPKERPNLLLAVDLEEEILAWLKDPTVASTIRLLSGGPGSGKSTFAKILAASASCGGGRKVLFVPLHLLDVTGDLVESVERFVRGDRFLTANPLDPKQGDPRLLLIFDGLDELASQGQVGAEVASSFAAEVRATIDRFNAQGADIRVLITGRPVAVEPQRAHFRRPEQMLHMLPYEIPKAERRHFSNQEFLDQDQRQSWWRNYGKCISKTYRGLPKELDREDLAEVTRQPLLNYLLALSYERGNVNFSKETSLNELYADLLDAVFERQWGGGPHPAVSGLEKDHFERILEEIAVAAWHGNGRTTSVREIEVRLRYLGLAPLLARFSDGVESGIGRLLLAFYFRAAERRDGGDPTFEFTHKSFGEYLVARRIVGMIETMHRRLAERREDFEAGWDEGRALEMWVMLTGPTPLELNLLEFVRREIALRDPSLVHSWQETLGAVLSSALKSGLPMERVDSPLTYQQMTHWCRNAEETLLACLNSCARVTTKRSRVEWPTKFAFGDLVGRLRGQRSASGKLIGVVRGENPTPAYVVLQCTSFLQLEEDTSLDFADLYGADFQGSLLEGCSFHGAILEGACLQGADLLKAKLIEARLIHADLRQAILRGGRLHGADLTGADLRGADLRVASFRGADLRYADLRGADLRGADLHEAELANAKMEGAVLSSPQLAEIGLSPRAIQEIQRVVTITDET